MESLHVECDVIVEEFHPRTGAVAKTWKCKDVSVVLEDDMDSRVGMLYVPPKIKSAKSIPVKIIKNCSTQIKLHHSRLKFGQASVRIMHPKPMQVMFSKCDPVQLKTWLLALRDITKPRKRTRARRSPDKTNRNKENRCPRTPNGSRVQSSPTKSPVQWKKTKAKSREDLKRAKAKERQALYEESRATLCHEQKVVLRRVIVERQNVFFTGSAGTGKSYLLQQIIKCLPKSTTAATSSTGITAVHINGSTVYHWAGIGHGKEEVKELVARVRRSRETVARWRKTKVLIIDEISMLDGGIFTKLEAIARVVRDDSRPFGGMQLVVCGDFFQLPPVTKKGISKSFCFDTSAWAKTINCTVELTHVYRQSDPEFVELLNNLRIGKCPEESAALLNECINKDLDDGSGILPTSLLTLKVQVDKMNQSQLSKLRGEPVRLAAKDVGAKHLVEALTTTCPARKHLELKIGAQVILLRNLDVEAGLCNGSRGIVVRFTKTHRHPTVRFASGHEQIMTPETWHFKIGGQSVASRTQVPLDLAWAISVHKSQGMSLDRAQVSLRNVFEYGQAYVALSRVRSLEGLSLSGFRPSQVKAHPSVLRFYDTLERVRKEAEKAAAA